MQINRAFVANISRCRMTRRRHVRSGLNASPAQRATNAGDWVLRARLEAALGQDAYAQFDMLGAACPTSRSGEVLPRQISAARMRNWATGRNNTVRRRSSKKADGNSCSPPPAKRRGGEPTVHGYAFSPRDAPEVCN